MGGWPGASRNRVSTFGGTNGVCAITWKRYLRIARIVSGLVGVSSASVARNQAADRPGGDCRCRLAIPPPDHGVRNRFWNIACGLRRYRAAPDSDLDPGLHLTQFLRRQART